MPTPSPRALAALALAVLLSACTEAPNPQYTEWAVYGGDPGFTKYAALDQINRANVGQLEVAWTHEAGEVFYSNQASPIVVDGVLYVTTPRIKALALDAATGEELWRFDPFDGATPPQPNNRGVAYWADGDDRRIFHAGGARLYALDAATGEPIPSFGDGGSIDLLQGLDRDAPPTTRLWVPSPGVIYGDLIILGSALNDGPSAGSHAPGHIRAYDVRTGERAWIFHTIPYPGELGYDTWPADAYQRAGSANAWGGLSLDPERGLVFVPTGSAAYDHHGGDRIGKNLFANALVALDAATGAYVWHFQTVHHDLWDYDLPCPPTLVTVERDGRTIDAVAQPTKMGHLFVFDRETGEPVFPIEERPVPQTTLPGEVTWPTQPFPTAPPPYALQGFTEADVTDLSPEAAAYVRTEYLEKYGPAELFPPPSLKGDLIVPQFNGGGEWGGATYDPTTGLLYVNASNVPEMLYMVEAPEDAGYPYDHISAGHLEVWDPDGYPISKRPWGTLTAIDLNAGDFAWQVPLGTYPELEAQGLPPTGTFNIGGSLVTAGGLVFIGATMDERFRAFDKATGELLWETQLPAGGYATPATYEINGRQYVVIAAGGGGKPGTPPGDAIVAFALPEGG